MNDLTQFIIKTVLSILAFTAIAIFVFMGLQSYNRHLDYVGMQDCATAYRLEYNDSDNNTTVIRPVDDLYKECLEQKGINR